MASENEKIPIDDAKHADYQTLSPSRKASAQSPVIKDDVDSIEAPPPQIQRQPRRILHFSDGILEEYSTDEEEIEERHQEQLQQEEESRRQTQIDPKSLTWVPWMLHYTWFAGSTILRYCDSWGEKLAWFFGITSPKYYYELEEFKRMQEEEAARQSKLETEMHGWNESGAPEVIGSDPTKTTSSSEEVDTQPQQP